jgi:hypothetical protein
MTHESLVADRSPVDWGRRPWCRASGLAISLNPLSLHAGRQGRGRRCAELIHAAWRRPASGLRTGFRPPHESACERGRDREMERAVCLMSEARKRKKEILSATFLCCPRRPGRQASGQSFALLALRPSSWPPAQKKKILCGSATPLGGGRVSLWLRKLALTAASASPVS